MIYIFTVPGTFTIRFKVKDSKKNDENKSNKNGEEIEEMEIEFEGFSTIAFYKLSGSKKFNMLKLPEINSIFLDYLRKYLERLYSKKFKSYIF